MNQPPTDSELVALCLNGDTVAFGILIDRHRVRLERLLRAVLHDPFTLDDVWQETLLRAYLNLEQLREPARFGAWLCSIAINMARTQRSASFPKALSWDSLRDSVTDHAEWVDPVHPSPEALAIQQEAINWVRQAIAHLPPAEREAVILVYLDELSHKDAALQLGASLSAIKVRVHRGRERLRTALQAEFAPVSHTSLKENNMIQVDLHNVMLSISHTPKDTVGNGQPSLTDILLNHRVVLLKEQAGERAVPIWIGQFEATQMLSHLTGQALKRPITYDLTKALLDIAQVVVERVVISRLHESTFYASLIVKTVAKTSEVDCRPSDAINLALRLHVPMFVSDEVIMQVGLSPEADGSYSLAKALDMSMRIASTEEAKENIARARESSWQSAQSVDLDQLVSARDELLREFVEAVTTDSEHFSNDDKFRQFLSGYLGR